MAIRGEEDEWRRRGQANEWDKTSRPICTLEWPEQKGKRREGDLTRNRNEDLGEHQKWAFERDANEWQWGRGEDCVPIPGGGGDNGQWAWG
jgi:hypothetical protein